MSNSETNVAPMSQQQSDNVMERSSPPSGSQVGPISPRSSLGAFKFDFHTATTFEAGDSTSSPYDDPDGTISPSKVAASRERDNELTENTFLSPATRDSLHPEELELNDTSTLLATHQSSNNVRDSSETSGNVSFDAYSCDAQLEATTIPLEPTGAIEIVPSRLIAGNSATTDAVGDAKAKNEKQRLWAPFVLTRLGLSLFVATFFLLAVSITTLFLISNSNNGVASVNSNYYYLWTYTPTAVFVLIDSLWGFVQYRALQLMPWLLMSQKYVPAAQSVLLDYISQWNVIALAKAARQKHFLVVLAISGALLMKLNIAFATGLFSIAQVDMPFPTSFVVDSAFNNSNFGDFADFSDSDLIPLLKAWEFTHLNATPTLGVYSNNVFPTFHENNPTNRSSPLYESNYGYQATVDILTTSLSCEQANVTASVVPFSNISSLIVLTLKSQSCSMNASAGAVDTFAFTPPYNSYDLQFSLGPCKDKDSQLGGPLCATERGMLNNDTVLWVYFAAMQSDDSVGEFDFPTISQDGSILWSSVRYIAMACRPSVTTGKGQVNITTDPSTGLPAGSAKIQEAVEIPGLQVNSTTVSLPVSLLSQAYCAEYLDHIYAYFSNTTSDELASLANFGVLSSSVEASVASVMAQEAGRYLLMPTNTTVQGIVFKPDVRLIIQPFSFGIILGSICVAMIISLALLLFYAHHRVVSRDPTSIGGLATILARSGNASIRFQQTGCMSEKKLSELLSNDKYRTETSDEGVFLIDRKGRDVTPIQTQEETDMKWWRPFALSPVALVLTLFLTISLIAVLEVFKHFSDKYDGLADFTDQALVQYLWKFIPAISILVVQVLYEMISTSVRVVQPFHTLHQGRAPKSVIMELQQYKLPISTFIYGLSKRHWALIFATFPVLLGPILPIAVSGLYTTSITTFAGAVNVTLQDSFQFVSYDDTLQTTVSFYDHIGNPDVVTTIGKENDLSSMTPELIMMLNLSYPTWTYEQTPSRNLQIRMEPGTWAHLQTISSS